MTPEQITAAVADARLGPVSVTIRRVLMPRTFGDSYVTTIRAAGPGVDLDAVARLLGGQPGCLQASRAGAVLVMYWRAES